jgi:hypothetical protein
MCYVDTALVPPPSELSSRPRITDRGSGMAFRECPSFLNNSEHDRVAAPSLPRLCCLPPPLQRNRPPTPTPLWRRGSTACCNPARRSHAVRWRIVARPNTGSGQTITRRWLPGTGSRCPQKRFCSEPTIRRVTPLYVGPRNAGLCALCGRPNPERAPVQPSPRLGRTGRLACSAAAQAATARRARGRRRRRGAAGRSDRQRRWLCAK